MSYISLKNFGCVYHPQGFQKKIAVADVTISDIAPGEIVAIVGPNGAGKTSLLDVIVGRRHSDGSIHKGDESGREKVSMAYVPQNVKKALIYDASIAENFMLNKTVQKARTNWGLKFYFSKALRKKDEEGIRAFLQEVDIDFLCDRLSEPPSNISGGEQQLLSILVALYHRPDIIILDEPTSKLDEVNKIKIASLILRSSQLRRDSNAEESISVILSSHDLTLVQKIANRSIILNDGRVQSIRGRIGLAETSQFAGAIRKVVNKNGLSKFLPGIDIAQIENWWCSNFFGKDYFEGDNSHGGSLSTMKLSRKERTEREIMGIIKLCKLRSPARVLDVPCGWGRHASELAKMGYEVTGVDLSQKYIDQANCNVLESKSLQFIKNDMRTLTDVCNNSFDLIINMWTSFGFFSNADNANVLRRFSEILKPGGLLLIHSDMNPRRIKSGIFDEPPIRSLIPQTIDSEVTEERNLSVIECYCEQDKYVYGRWQVGQSEPHFYRVRLYDEDEWRQYAEDLGFIIEGIYGDIATGDGLTEMSQECVVLLRKQGL